MFTDSAPFYDALYSFKDYAAEAESTLALLPEHTRSILDVACGTAEHHRYLRPKVSVDGVDLNGQFLEAARKKNPDGLYLQADMREFSTGKTYDAVLCLFSSIGYLESMADIVRALDCMQRHLAPNGIIIVEPWFAPDAWNSGRVHMLTAETEEMKICRMSQSDLDGDISVIHFHYLVGTHQDGVRRFSEKHRLRLSSTDEMLEAFKEAGLAAHFDSHGLNGRGLYTARRKQGNS